MRTPSHLCSRGIAARGAISLFAMATLLAVSARAQTVGAIALGDADAQAGRQLYLEECSACHGERGDGAGPAAQFLDPRPRNFTKKIFKVRTTESGMRPRTEDVLATIERGFPGTAMPPFAFLSETERRQLAAEVLSLAGLLHETEPPRLPAPASPPPSTRETIARGRDLYRQAECATCHGKEGKGDGPAVATLKDVDDRPVPARDLTSGLFRGGGDRLDLYYRISAGMDGSPMPAFASSLEDADRWALVDYVISLAKPRPSRPVRGDRAAQKIAERSGCRGCHVLADGRGGAVGPDLRLSAQKLRAEWLEAFLRRPRESGKVYPSSVHRMPDVRLSEEEVRIMKDYVLQLGKRHRPTPPPDLAGVSPQKLDQGKTVYASRCAACHALGSSPAGGGQPPGPDLTTAAARLDFDWARRWIGEHAKTVAGSAPLTDADVEAVGVFFWKTSSQAATTAVRGG